jgi:hypothetical protein
MRQQPPIVASSFLHLLMCVLAGITCGATAYVLGVSGTAAIAVGCSIGLVLLVLTAPLLEIALQLHYRNKRLD